MAAAKIILDLRKMIGNNTPFGKKGFAGIMLFAVSILWLSPAYGGGTITENFNDNRYDTSLWGLAYMGHGVAVEFTNNRLEGTVSGNGSANLNGHGFTLIGDFDMKVDFTLINWPQSNGTQIYMGIYNLSPSDLFNIGRANGNDQEVYFTYIMSQYTGTGVTGPVSNGMLGMVRTGNKMEAFYWNGTAWQSIGSATNASLGTRVGITMGIGPYGNNYSGIPAKAAFDNIWIDYTTLGPSFDSGNPAPAIYELLLD